MSLFWNVRMTVRREHFLHDAFSKVMAINKKDIQRAKLFISFSGEEGYVFNLKYLFTISLSCAYVACNCLCAECFEERAS